MRYEQNQEQERREGGEHSHAHDPGHVRALSDFGRAFAVGVAQNLGYCTLKGVFGILSASLALLANAGYNLSVQHWQAV